MQRRGLVFRSVLILTAIVVQLPLISVVCYFALFFFRDGRTELRFLGFNAYARLPRALNGAGLVRDQIYRANGRPIPNCGNVWAIV